MGARHHSASSHTCHIELRVSCKRVCTDALKTGVQVLWDLSGTAICAGPSCRLFQAHRKVHLMEFNLKGAWKLCDPGSLVWRGVGRTLSFGGTC